ncbi:MULTISPECIES: biopolymer transporter ExbD [Marinobacterium]|jgi:biopolymer transport protein ExbD|uniref:Outer membrane transport energization protein ExbD n=1 Tax=Marinobacterium iners DSM 11526 TaxID=1122198 RepID=A0A1H3XKF6_9GAMM|nr:biopolymer transporter ExbD [Marinobacterium iners]QSR34065.1 biopolymer transporter ExbD [Marinobacterium iners]SDZ99907.1 outer membrane transport energization protein ExbD [Marinobacterium iners DSM 11526]
MRQRLNLEMLENDAEIDMTPMLDIVFIMLIFFIVSTSFVREAGVEIERPVSDTSEVQESQGVMLAITAQDEVWLDRQPVDIRMIRPTLERLKVEQPDLGVMIQADKDAKTGLLVQVMDQVKLSGIEQVAVATREGKG